MTSIKEFDTTGMSYLEREELLKNVTPIPIGEIVYKSGGAFDEVDIVKVDEGNQITITMCWNSSYFDTLEKAEYKTRIAHAEYGRYLWSAWN